MTDSYLDTFEDSRRFQNLSDFSKNTWFSLIVNSSGSVWDPCGTPNNLALSAQISIAQVATNPRWYVHISFDLGRRPRLFTLSNNQPTRLERSLGGFPIVFPAMYPPHIPSLLTYNMASNYVIKAVIYTGRGVHINAAQLDCHCSPAVVP